VSNSSCAEGAPDQIELGNVAHFDPRDAHHQRYGKRRHGHGTSQTGLPHRGQVPSSTGCTHPKLVPSGKTSLRPQIRRSALRRQLVLARMLWTKFFGGSTFGQRAHPLQPGLRVGEQRAAAGASRSVRLEPQSACRYERPVNGLKQKRLEFGAVHSAWISSAIRSLLYVRESKRASSARPRFILDFTVPSGT